MTEQEAIKGLKNIFSEYELTLPFTDSVEILNITIEAIKKQIPKRVQDAEVSENPEDMQYMREDALYGHCPTCGNVICSVWNPYNCGDCGQAIDWRN